nr:serine/threonine-protein kinase Pink1, mitochondrial-like [Cherax quadricarinatus]
MSKRAADTPMGNSEKKKRKHLTLSVMQKVELLQKLDRGVSVRHLNEEYGIGTTTVYDLKKQKDKLLKYYNDNDDQNLMKNRKTLHRWQSEGGAGAGKNAAECGSESQASASIGTGPSVASSVVSRLAQSLVRKVSAPLWAEAKRSATKRLVFGESAPYFALVGVTLVSGSQLGLVTKEDELENLCCNIREAISRAGWLHNPEYWQHQKDLKDGQEESFDVLETEHTFTLNDFVLGPAIDKGCSAVVYAARWNAVDKEESLNIPEYPLAVKMMFNYEAESNAPAILRAMYKEMIPARSLQLDGEQLEWQERFCSKHMNLPPHPNIVEMPCVFVDSIPFLKDSMQLYPDALPTRINPSGYGRNMSLFCVMKR